MKELSLALTEALADPADRFLGESILGTGDVARIVDCVDAFCRLHLSAGVDSCAAVELSVGAGLPLLLDDGRRVFLKVFAPGEEPRRLHEASRIQAALAAAGYPCPAVLLHPMPLAAGLAKVDEFRREGEPADAHQPAVRKLMAAALADLISRTSGVVPGPHRSALRVQWDGLWPKPHNALFDFERTAGGAQWIDELGRAARGALLSPPSGPDVVGHADWSVKHFRFAGARVAVIYDWDSLRLDQETALVGTAAATFPCTWDLDVRITPSAEELRAFIEEYQDARRRRFSQEEYQRAWAAALYATAYCGRCEHAIEAPWTGSFREALRVLATEAESRSFLM